MRKKHARLLYTFPPLMQKSDADIERNLFLELIQVGNCFVGLVAQCALEFEKYFTKKNNYNRLFFFTSRKKNQQEYFFMKLNIPTS